MGAFEDLNAKMDEVRQAVIDERAEVMAALAAHTGNVANDPALNLTADQKTQLMSKLDDLTTAVKGVFDASTTGTTGTTDVTGTPPPTDVTGTAPPTPTAPAPTAAQPTPNPNPTP